MKYPVLAYVMSCLCPLTLSMKCVCHEISPEKQLPTNLFIKFKKKIIILNCCHIFLGPKTDNKEVEKLNKEIKVSRKSLIKNDIYFSYDVLKILCS